MQIERASEVGWRTMLKSHVCIGQNGILVQPLGVRAVNGRKASMT
jgi:hypothetical protein